MVRVIPPLENDLIVALNYFLYFENYLIAVAVAVAVVTAKLFRPLNCVQSTKETGGEEFSP